MSVDDLYRNLSGSVESSTKGSYEKSQIRRPNSLFIAGEGQQISWTRPGVAKHEQAFDLGESEELLEDSARKERLSTLYTGRRLIGM
jgi:hypothetical protein